MKAGGKELTFESRAGVVVVVVKLGGIVVGKEPISLKDARLFRSELDVAIDDAYRMAIVTPQQGAC